MIQSPLPFLEEPLRDDVTNESYIVSGSVSLFYHPFPRAPSPKVLAKSRGPGLRPNSSLVPGPPASSCSPEDMQSHRYSPVSLLHLPPRAGSPLGTAPADALGARVIAAMHTCPRSPDPDLDAKELPVPV